MVNLTCAPNTSYDSRTCIITVKADELEESIIISQDTDYAIQVSPTSFLVSESAQTVLVEVKANVRYSVEIEPSASSWITYAGTKGLSRETIVLVVSQNDTYDSREGHVTIKQDSGGLSETITVRQAQKDGLFLSVPEYDLSNSSQVLTVEVQANVNYEASSTADWIHVVATKALNSSQLSIQVDSNESFEKREGKVVVKQVDGDKQGVLTIRQEETAGIFVSPGPIEITKEAQSIEIEVRYNVDFSVVVPEEAKGTMITSVGYEEDGYIMALSKRKYKLAIAENTTLDPREASVTFKQKDGSLSGTVRIVQAQSDMIGVSLEEVSFPYKGGSATVQVEANVDYSTYIEGSPQWISINKDSQTKGLDQLSYTIQAVENTGDERSADIVFAGNGIVRKVHVIQEGYALILSHSSITADCLQGAEVSVQVKATGHWSVKEKGTSFLKISQEGGEAGTYTVSATFNDANCTNTDRYANLEFVCEGLSKTVQIKQVPAFRFDSLDHTLPSAGGDYKFYFYIPRPFESAMVRTYDYDDGFYRLYYYTGEDNAPEAINIQVEALGAPIAGEVASDVNPVDTYMWMMYNFKANYGKNARTGRFRLSFTESGQTLVSEWINITQLGDVNAGDGADGIVTTLQQHSKGKGVPLVILGDGFTKTDITNGYFADAARKAYEYFFSVEPVTSLRDYFDVWSITAISSSNIFDGSTRFGSQFMGGTRIDGNDDTAVRYASKIVPSNRTNDMLVIIVMNSTRYAGTCYLHFLDYSDRRELVYSVAYVPMSTQQGMTYENVIHHEACGHGLGKLADEYTGSGTIPPSEISSLNIFQNAGAYVNVDLQYNVSSTLWADFAADSRFDYEHLGAYEGGYTYDYGVYRPTQTSIMVTNKGTFNAPSRAQIYKRVMDIANDYWTFDYEEFVNFDAPFRNRFYNSSSAQAAPRNYVERDDFEPLAPPVFVKDN